MAEPTESGQAYKGFYDRLSPQFIEAAYFYKEWREGAALDHAARELAKSGFEALHLAKKDALVNAFEDSIVHSSDENIAAYRSILEAHGTPTDIEGLDEVVALRSKLIPGEFVLLTDGSIYRISDANREIIFTLQKPKTGNDSIRDLAGWIVFGRLEGDEEVVGFPVSLSDTVGAEAVDEMLYRR